MTRVRAILLRRAAVALALALLGTCLLAVAAATTAPADAAVTYRVLITGDSITQGSSGDYTWRYRLWNKLSSTAPGQVAFVGTRTDLYDVVNSRQGSQYYAASFAAKAHSAVWGDSYQAGLGSIASQVGSTNANVLVVMLGSNDLTYFTTPQQTIDNLRTYIARARAAAPGLDVVVGEVLNKYDPWAGQYLLRDQVSEYASRLATLASQLNTASERVVVAPTRDGWDSRTMTWDGTHPDATGEALIAQRVSQGLAKIGIGTASPDVSGAKSWSVPGPTPSVTAGSEQATLGWNRTPTGSTAMFIEQRLVNTGGAWQRLPYAVSGDGWTAELLAAGGSYQFRLVPSKGFQTGIAGPAVSVTVGGATPSAILTVNTVANGASSQGGQKATASWSASADAQGYLLSLRLMHDSQPSWTDLPYPVAQRQWAFEPLFQGRRYQVRVRGSRGFLTGPWKAGAVVRTRGVPGGFRHVALGDSYSSGLGASGSYSGGGCEQAANAWVHDVYLYQRSGGAHLACAGGKIPDVRDQLAAMDSYFAAYPDAPQLVTLTVGGNDVGFSDVLSECVLSSCTDMEADKHSAIITTGTKLSALYAEVRARHPYADIIVGGYPGVVERSGASFNPLCLRIGDHERDMIDRLSRHLNNEITDEAAGAHVWALGERIEAKFSGHNACSADAEWVHAGNLDIGGVSGLIDKKSFHPNDSGQYAYTEVANATWEASAG